MSKAKNIEETRVQALNGTENSETTEPVSKEIKAPKKSKTIKNDEANVVGDVTTNNIQKSNLAKKKLQTLPGKKTLKKSVTVKKETEINTAVTEKNAKKEDTAKSAKEKILAKKEPAKVADKKAAAKKTVEKKAEISAAVKVTFVVRFHTKHGQSLYISGKHPVFGNDEIAAALPMQYLNEELWTATIDLDKNDLPKEGVVYNYLLKNDDGSLSYDWGSDKVLTAELFTSEDILIIDSWNFAGYYENAFYTEPFKNVLLKQNYTPVKITAPKTYTHTFKVKAPLLKKGETLCIIGNDVALGNWNEADVVLMNKKEKEDFYAAKINLSKAWFPIVYKYCVYDIGSNKIIRYEDGNNRILYDAFVKNKKTIVNDGFAVLPANTWKGAGVAIPVFSLRSKNSGGIGEFTDIKLLVDWAKSVGLKLVQILPVNDTTATHTWTDSYPYAAISAFALHPMFLNLAKAAGDIYADLLKDITEEQLRLNKLEAIDYEAVNNLKWNFIKQLYPLQKKTIFASADYKQYFELNKHWLVPYAAFCYFRDKYSSADFNTWQSHKNYNAEEAALLLEPSAKSFDEIAIHLYVQYLLHLQLKEAAQYAHDNGIIVKGDIPIGIYRYGADAWQHPELYHMDMQAGAPPDDFAVTGQNWGFPTYNWEKMKEDGFAWWKQRFEQMSYYFDAFRIDHILGFFRIWSIPTHSVEGIMGHFEPSIPVHIHEFNQKGIWFDYTRYCKPYITEQLLDNNFGDQKDHVKYTFLNYDGFGRYQVKPEFATQQKVESYFSWQQDNDHNRWLKKQLFSLLSNVILFEAEGSQGQQFHFRFGIEDTISFKELDAHLQYQLKELYIDYFFKRQDNFWMYGALQKLPALKRATNMLVCGEDLGLVPGCVPEVMRQLGLLSLEIQRMPKDPKRTFFHPADAPYLSVVTPSTHDISTIRGWWEEDRNLTQKFFNDELGQWGAAPYFCDAWVNKAIVVQHLYSPAMWSIFQLQDILGSDRKIRRPNPHDERINVPANPKHYWRYRMHLTLEDLIKANEFNTEFAANIKASGRV
ncbi:4-alpha-glucanotransferase [Panacibacter ginsenosidivorans]|uniref:4-alpha-glucanotransferase n=2 Tax=Panacibacter ginsenosidivorans TaxID=1813871 RepID=A0A5B8VFT3_9BACT|nr:4-alpha-glucanotransferase [Panacibacter ginsenosidivorans]